MCRRHYEATEEMGSTHTFKFICDQSPFYINVGCARDPHPVHRIKKRPVGRFIFLNLKLHPAQHDGTIPLALSAHHGSDKVHQQHA